MFELILVRHGVTAWNKQTRFQGHIDIPLDAEGLHQAETLSTFWAAAQLARPAFILASDLGRAVQTAQPLARLFNLPIHQEPLWRERHYGDFEGKTHDELLQSRASEFARWRAREPDFSPPGGGESIRVFQDRVTQALSTCLAHFHALPAPLQPAQAKPPMGLVFTHGGVLGTVFRLVHRLSPDDRSKIEIPNTGINRLVWTPQNSWHVTEWAKLPHLSARLDLK